MRVTFRAPPPLGSVFGFMELKTGVTVAVLFALINKVSGVYGLIAVFHGGSFAQISMYLYSVLALAGFAWGMRAITDEDPKQTFYFAHAFLGDHLLNTIWTAFFAVSWWYYNPHDGKRIANSDAQKEMMNMGGSNMTDGERLAAAQAIWHAEKGHAATVLIIGWLLKIYFALLLYSYAIHLRKGTYRSLPLTNVVPAASLSHPNNTHNSSSTYPDDYELDEDEFYHMPLRSGGGLLSSSLAPSFEFPTPGSQTTPRPTASTSRRQSKRILRDLEAPLESVLWDEEDEQIETPKAKETTNGHMDAIPGSDAESETGDISAGIGGRSAKKDKGAAMR